jgi:hypothetical protein
MNWFPRLILAAGLVSTLPAYSQRLKKEEKQIVSRSMFISWPTTNWKAAEPAPKERSRPANTLKINSLPSD